ncbi:TIR domain-containing protein [Nocardioides sp. SYSU DS0663]|uniref:TIR domain-containing protein n=1 Tax=Nocardioides sp. SYSU DS0663 TaxID=3416445 RepID=UPI003F4B4537
MKFPATLIADLCRETIERTKAELGADHEDYDYVDETFSVKFGHRQIYHTNLEEWLADYRLEHTFSVLRLNAGFKRDLAVDYDTYDVGPVTDVTYSAASRSEIEEVLERFNAAADSMPQPPAPPKSRPTVFIGHGRSPAWRDLKDHLVDHHGYKVEAYETGARAGHHIRDVLSSMTRKASFAVLVLTGEDDGPDGSIRARQNVVHETGLFQGALGFDRAIVLLENGVTEFSNLYGIQQVRFDQGRIRETFGDVLATLHREFGD